MIEGRCYLAGRSDFSPAKLYLQADDYQLIIEGSPTVTGSLSQLKIANRLGNIARKITLPDGSVFETADNDAIDLAVSNSRQSTGFMAFVHLLERNIAFAIISIFIIAGVVFSGFKWGLPAASHVVAHALPDAANQALSSNVLEFLDEHFFEASKLSVEQQENIRHHFLDAIVPLYQAEDALEFTLHFRLWPLADDKSIANALALPSGDIIVTDRFIELAQTQDEINIVLLHEMGHIVERHSLKQVIEGSAIAIAISMAFGDVSWLADMGVGVGSFLISSFYSRSHEAEADQFAYQHSLQAGINPKSLGLILTRMEQDMSTFSCHKTDAEACPNKRELDQKEGDGNLLGYFSTHPSSQERTEMGKRYQICFDQGLSICPKGNEQIVKQSM